MSTPTTAPGVPGPPVLFVGAGPGDPGLLPLRGQRLLAEAQVVVFDAEVSPAVLEGAPEAAERLRVGEDARGVPPPTVAALLIARASAGARVVRLITGDASTFGVEAEALAAAGVAFEVVPGVTTEVAAAAYAGISPGSLGHGGPAILDATGPVGADWPFVGAIAQTLVIRVSASALTRVIEGLIRGGRHPDTPAALIAEATTAEQRTVSGPLAVLASEARHEGVSYPAVLVVGDAAQLRRRLAWVERRPLFGRRVVVTRPRAQAARFAALLEAYGAEVLTLPTIRLEPPDDWGPLDEAVGQIATFDWLVLTSANGVAAFRERLGHAGLDARALAGVRLAAIGSETARALEAGGLRPDLVPPEYRAEELAESLRPHVGQGSAVLIVRAAEAREVLPRALAGLGARLTVAPAYRTATVKEGADAVVELLDAGRVDAVTFTSSSTVRGFMTLVGAEERRRLLSKVALAAIGPITAATVAEYGLEVAVTAREYTTTTLAAAIAAHFARSR